LEQSIKGYVKVHAAGQHIKDKKQVWISTYKFVKDSHELEFEYARIFTEKKDVQIIGVTSDY